MGGVPPSARAGCRGHGSTVYQYHIVVQVLDTKLFGLPSDLPSDLPGLPSDLLFSPSSPGRAAPMPLECGREPNPVTSASPAPHSRSASGPQPGGPLRNRTQVTLEPSATRSGCVGPAGTSWN